MNRTLLVIAASCAVALAPSGSAHADRPNAPRILEGVAGVGVYEPSSMALERASGDQLARAIGHYARARSLLIAALREFDKGAKLANPQSLLEATEWRATLIERAQDLERVLDPQPRVSAGGARFEPDRRLLGEAAR